MRLMRGFLLLEFMVALCMLAFGCVALTRFVGFFSTTFTHHLLHERAYAYAQHIIHTLAHNVARPAANNLKADVSPVHALIKPINGAIDLKPSRFTWYRVAVSYQADLIPRTVHFIGTTHTKGTAA